MLEVAQPSLQLCLRTLALQLECIAVAFRAALQWTKVAEFLLWCASTWQLNYSFYKSKILNWVKWLLWIFEQSSLIGNAPQWISSYHPFIWQCWKKTKITVVIIAPRSVAGMRWSVTKAQFIVETHFTHRSNHVHKIWSQWAPQVWTTGWSPSAHFLQSHCREWCFCGRRQTGCFI